MGLHLHILRLNISNLGRSGVTSNYHELTALLSLAQPFAGRVTAPVTAQGHQ